MNKSLLMVAGGTAASMLSGCATVQKADTTKPNIVYILADDWGYGDVSCLNEESKLHTPHTDQIAKDGMIFTDAHSNSAVCTPTRYGVLTGRYAWRSRLKRGVLNGYSNHLIKPERETVASMLKKQGYHTACIGKWHLGWDWARSGKKVDFTKEIKNGPDANGFDYYYSHCGSLDMAPYVYVENGKVTAQPNRETHSGDKYGWWRKGPTGADFDHWDVTPNFTRRGCNYIKEQAKTDKPFFLYLPLPSPHTPILPTKEWQGKSGTNPYGDFVLMVDDCIGQITKSLKDAGVYENTLVIVTSDNGCSPAAKINELQAKGHEPSYKFRGHKADIFDGGHRVPFVVSWPAKIKAGSKCDETVCLTDLMATAADITGGKYDDKAGVDSVSLLPAFEGKKIVKSGREAVIHHSINGSFAIRSGKWKLNLCPGSGGWSNPRPNVAKKQGLPAIQLYDMENDIGETKNVYKQYPDIVKHLLALTEKYVTEGRSTNGKKQSNDGKTPYLPKDFSKIRKELNL